MHGNGTAAGLDDGRQMDGTYCSCRIATKVVFVAMSMTYSFLSVCGCGGTKMSERIDVVGGGGEPNVSTHLGVVGRINLGSFYTPAKYVALVGEWLLQNGIGADWTIADLSSGYGAFFELQSVPGLDRCRYVGNDIDAVAVAKGRAMFPDVEWSVANALCDVSRGKFGFTSEERLVIVGNPPYNDVTSQINNKVKTPAAPIDADIKTRDLGLSFLLAYDKIEASYVAVLHPLSYLIKKSNFNAARRFFSNYAIVEHVVFPSSEFAGTSKLAAFPVIVALYRRVEGNGLSYEQVQSMRFVTTDGRRFSLDGFDYVADSIRKYPHKERYEPEILFYTMRDVNALKRSRTFIKKRIPNAVDVDPALLAYYCYIDCFKEFAEVPYYLGNFNVPFIKDRFHEIESDVVSVSKSLHPEIFGPGLGCSEESLSKVKGYIHDVLSR